MHFRTSDRQDSYGLSDRRKSPLEETDLPTLLAAITPEGAPAYHAVGWRCEIDFPIPITGPAPTHRSMPKELRPMLAPGWPPRRDGLPAWRPHGRSNRWTAVPGRRGADTPRRQVAAAIAADLGCVDLVEISAAMLGLRDHELVGRDELRTDGDPRRAREFRRRGRQLLAELDAWPWAHAPAGGLPAYWRSDQMFLEPLWSWHARACAELDRELARCRSAGFAGERWAGSAEP